MLFRLFSRLLLAALMCASLDAVGAPKIGVFYFPGWHTPPNKDTWAPIRANGGLEPLLGWYEVGDPAVLDQQLHWMSQYGLDFVVFDWYTEQKKNGGYYSPAVDGYLQSKSKGDVRFAILWANNPSSPATLEEYDHLLDFWVSHYFLQKTYYEIDNKPVVFIVAPDLLAASAASIGLSTPQLLNRARAAAKAHGLAGIYFVASTQALADNVKKRLPDNGYDALFAYNYHYGLSGAFVKKASSHSYAELSAGYEQSWNWIVSNTKLPYFVPLTSGWDRKPWGGSTDPLHDNSVSTPESFGAQLIAAKALMSKYPAQTNQTAVVCCWNEFGEGSVIEPTKKYGFGYLQQVKKIFGAASK